MSEKALRWIINIAGIVCLYAFLAIRFQSLFNFVVQEKIIPEYWENTKYGELYYFNFIKNFREKNLPKCHEKYRHSGRMPKLEDADLITFGDSFFDFTRMKTFPEKLGDSLKCGVYYARFDRPFLHFGEQNFTNKKEKILLYESAERYIPVRFTSPQDYFYIPDTRSTLRKTLASIRDFLFLENTEPLYSQLLYRCYATTGLYSAISTFKFRTWGQITSLTPKYTLKYDIPWLFYYEQLNEDPSSFYYQHTDKEINTYCDNIADLSKQLKKVYNLDMVFLPIPSKYTIYHTLLNNDKYNNFLPRIYAGLEKRGIPVVKVYDDFMSADTLLYYGTDTHWRETGLNIALNKTLNVLRTEEKPSTYLPEQETDKKSTNQLN